ncbi:MAG: hypothetical protein HYZ75_12380 [Elusimicrobia bacterium]|nr:hypothetical protein [Elusimicrobiota bacterium]
MEAVVRTYSGEGAKELFAVLEKNATEVQILMRSVNGFVGYTLARTDTGGFSVTICLNKAGIEESLRKAKEWVAQNAGHLNVEEPQVLSGKVIG